MRFESFRADDGTLLAAHHTGNGGLPVVLANGLGGTFTAWKPLVDRFRDRCRFYSWDYRGLYRSQAPADHGNLGVETHAADLRALLDHFELEEAVIAGWSMGVQVALELHRDHADRFLGMILMNGTYGAPFDTAFGSLPTRKLLPPFFAFGKAMAPITSAVVHAFARWEYTVPLASRFHLVDPRIDAGAFYGIAREFAHLDMDVYLETMLRLGDHDAGDVLSDVEVPVLIIAGDRDMMTPKAVTERMVHDMARAELFVVPRGTHYCLLEYPELVTLRVEKFLRDHYGLPPEDLEKKKRTKRARRPAKE